MSDYKLLIDGKLVSGAMALNVVNPATEEVVAVAPRADRAQLEQAVAAAKAAFPRWSKTPVRDRGAPIPISHIPFFDSLDLTHVNPRPQRTQLDIEVALFVQRGDRLARCRHVDQEDLIAGRDLREWHPPPALLALRDFLD